MIKRFAPRMEILPAAQASLWQDLRQAPELGFVLYGGTAIALRLGHRSSVDFDFFCERALQRDELRQAFPFLARATVLQDERDSFGVAVPCPATGDVVHLSFFGSLGFGRVGEPEITQDGALLVASLDDLMAQKVKVVLQRAEAKDYRDIAAMIEAGVDLAKGLASAQAMGMYGAAGFQPSESLKALTYFNDGDLETLTPVEKSVLVDAVASVTDLPHVQVLSPRLGIGESR